MLKQFPRMLAVALGAACITAGLAGCGAQATRTPDTTAAEASTVTPHALRFKQYSYKPHRTPEDLAAADYIKVTAVGTVEGFKEGVTYLTEPNNSPYPRIYMVVRVDRVFKGAKEPRLLADGRLYVEFDRGPVNTLDGKTPLNSMAVFEREVPRGTRVALFLTDPPPISDRVVNPQLDPGIRTLTPHPQGLIFEDVSRSGADRLVPGLIESEELPAPWRTLHSLDELSGRMASATR